MICISPPEPAFVFSIASKISGGQDITADDRHIRWRLVSGWFLDDVFDPVDASVIIVQGVASDNAVV